MKKVLIAILLAGVIALTAAPAVFAATQDVTWGELKCLNNPDACKPKGNG